MNIETNSIRRYITYEFDIKQPVQMVKLNPNMIISENPNLFSSLDRSINHSLIRNNSNFVK